MYSGIRAAIFGVDGGVVPRRTVDEPPPASWLKEDEDLCRARHVPEVLSWRHLNRLQQRDQPLRSAG
jgi:hypothetical protein